MTGLPYEQGRFSGRVQDERLQEQPGSSPGDLLGQLAVQEPREDVRDCHAAFTPPLGRSLANGARPRAV